LAAAPSIPTSLRRRWKAGIGFLPHCRAKTEITSGKKRPRATPSPRLSNAANVRVAELKFTSSQASRIHGRRRPSVPPCASPQTAILPATGKRLRLLPIRAASSPAKRGNHYRKKAITVALLFLLSAFACLSWLAIATPRCAAETPKSDANSSREAFLQMLQSLHVARAAQNSNCPTPPGDLASARRRQPRPRAYVKARQRRRGVYGMALRHLPPIRKSARANMLREIRSGRSPRQKPKWFFVGRTPAELCRSSKIQSRHRRPLASRSCSTCFPIPL